MFVCVFCVCVCVQEVWVTSWLARVSTLPGKAKKAINHSLIIDGQLPWQKPTAAGYVLGRGEPE